METEYIQVTTSVDDEAAARWIADLLVQRRLAACVHVSGPVTGTYRWRGAIEVAEEWICEATSSATLYEAIEAAIHEAHPYDEPSIVATPIVAGRASYLRWIAESVAANEAK